MAIHVARLPVPLCVFCSNPSLHGHDMRTMSIERVVSDVRMKEELGMTVLLLEDDHFFNDKDHAETDPA